MIDEYCWNYVCVLFDLIARIEKLVLFGLKYKWRFIDGVWCFGFFLLLKTHILSVLLG